MLYQQLKARSSGGDEAAAASPNNFDEHDLFQLAARDDVYTDYYLDSYDVPIWKPKSQLPPPDPRYKAYGRDQLYDTSLNGHAVLDTAQVAFRAVRGLLP